MKRAVIVAALLCFAVLGVSQSPSDKGIVKQDGTPSTNDPAKSAENKQHGASPLPPTQTIIYGPYPTPEQDDTKDQRNEDVQIQRKLAKFTKYLVWVGALQFIALIVQAIFFSIHSRHLGAVAVAAGDNAIAAKKSADALMNIERAWILIEKIEINGFAGPPDQEKIVSFSCHAKNYGRSPAMITGVVSKLEVRAKRDASDAPLNGDIYETIFPQGDPRIVPPERSFWFEPNESMILTPVQADAVQLLGQGREFIFAHGIIRYLDAFGRKSETRFNYRYEVTYFAPAGNAGFYLAEAPKGWNTWK
jgi:hypothetical protein